MRRPSGKRGFSLVEILVVVIIIMILAVILLPKYLSSSRTAAGKTVLAPKDRAKSVDCWNNLNQLRQAYQIATATGDDTKPQTIQDLQRAGRMPDSMLYCPVGGKEYPYRFNPATGEVSCPFPPHVGGPK